MVRLIEASLLTGTLNHIDIDIEILFCVEFCTTCNISQVGLLLRQTRINNKHI